MVNTFRYVMWDVEQVPVLLSCAVCDAMLEEKPAILVMATSLANNVTYFGFCTTEHRQEWKEKFYNLPTEVQRHIISNIDDHSPKIM